MPLVIKGKSYSLPHEAGQRGPTGSEIIEIENYFNLDGLILISSLAQDKPPVGYTKTRAMFAIAWIAMIRAGEILSLNDILNDYSIDDFDFVEEEEPKKDLTESSETAGPSVL
jgi:hypothetical protein